MEALLDLSLKYLELLIGTMAAIRSTMKVNDDKDVVSRTIH